MAVSTHHPLPFPHGQLMDLAGNAFNGGVVAATIVATLLRAPLAQAIELSRSFRASPVPVVAEQLDSLVDVSDASDDSDDGLF